VDTPMHDPANHEFLKGLHPIRRLATVQEIVDATLFLVRAPFITGEVLYVTAVRTRESGKGFQCVQRKPQLHKK